MDVFLLITYDADDNPHIRQPHTTEAGATARAERLGAEDTGIYRYEVACMELIDDPLEPVTPAQSDAILAAVAGRLGRIARERGVY